MKVNECMCNDVCCVKPETKLNEVARLMAERHIGSIPICDNNNCICGIVTDRDIILRTIACDKDCKATPVSDIMSTKVCTCQENDEMTVAENKMSQNQIKRLPVCDKNNKVVGILTLGDIAQNINELGKDQVSTVISDICCENKNLNAE